MTDARTVVVFGGFGTPGAALVFGLFAGLGALQFLAIAVIDRHLDPVFDALAIRSATAVVLAELLMPRVFPWHFGHTQIAFTKDGSGRVTGVILNPGPWEQKGVRED